MSRNVQVNTGHNNVIVDGTEYDEGASLIVSDETFSALTEAGRFTDGTMTDLGAVEPGDDLVSVQGTYVAAPAALTSVVAAGANPTKAEYDALRADVAALRTTVAALASALEGVGRALAAS